MRQRWIASGVKWFAVLVLTLAPATALARQDEPETEPVNARLEGYTGNVSLPETSSGLTWMCFVVLGVFTAAGLFKDAKRSHLD